jgi:hypothetical protein
MIKEGLGNYKVGALHSNEGLKVDKGKGLVHFHGIWDPLASTSLLASPYLRSRVVCACAKTQNFFFFFWGWVGTSFDDGYIGF